VSPISPSLWREISPHLDHALSLPEHERKPWLESFRLGHPELADLLEELLEEHRTLSREQFLENGPARLADESALRGRTIGPYRLLSLIGQGGMGTVWLAERVDGRFERRVAIKFLRLAVAAQGAERFRREGHLLGRLADAHIAELIDAGVTPGGELYLVLEHVEGEPIDQYCDRHSLSTETRIRLFLDVLGAVAQAHANLIVHRDLKPSNVLVRNDGQVKLLDFGIAKLLADDESSAAATQLTLDGGSALTLQFAAPEQVTRAAVTTATDVYALGVLLYLLLTGRHPAGPGPHSAADLLKAILENEPPRASETITALDAQGVAEKRATSPDRLRRLLRGDLDTIIAKALKKNPRERYASATAFAEELRRYLKHEPITARPDTLAYRAAKFIRRNRTAVALAGLVLVSLIAGVSGTLLQAHRAREERDFALRELSRAATVNDLEEFVLRDAAPSGKPFTVDELLDRAERIVERAQGSSADRVDLLVSIGRQYMLQDEEAKGHRIVEDAYSLSRGLQDRTSRAYAACALGASFASSGDPTRGESLYQEGISELGHEPQYAIYRFYCLLDGRQIADSRGDSQAAIARIEEAQRVLRASGFESEILNLRASIDLAEAYRQAGRVRDALGAFEHASTLLASLGRDNTQTAGTLYNNWAMTLFQMGRPLEAEELFRRAIAISRADTSLAAVSPMLLLNYGKTLRELGHIDEAADYVDRAYAKAQQAGYAVVVDQSLIERCRIYRTQHNLARATEMLALVEPRLRRNLPPGHYAFAGIAAERSAISLESGDPQNALKLADEAVGIVEAAIHAGRQGAVILPIVLMARSAAELELRNPDKAGSDAELCLRSLRASSEPGTFSDTTGRAYVALGRALEAQGKPEEAHAAFRSAAEQLDKTLGPDNPESEAAHKFADSSPQ